MSRKMIFYALFVLVTANLFYGEFWGLNTLIVAVLSVLVNALAFVYDSNASRPNSPKWWLAATLFLINGLAVFYSYNLLSVVLYIVSFLYFSAVHHAVQLSLPLGFVQSIQALFSGLYQFVESMIENVRSREKKDSNHTFVKILLYSVPVLIAVVFLKLYQSADETFYEMTKFINLDWISWEFIGFYTVLFLSGYGLFFFRSNPQINQFEDSLKNDISAEYTDGVQKYLGVSNEQKIVFSLLITLNLMLGLYNFIDLKFIIVDLPNPDPNLRYSELLHGGVNSLITSIVLVIFILTFFYRGQLNFQGKKSTRILALIWLCLNLLMVATTLIKNWEYISHWGLTYKRIGVYVYLLLAAIGLVLTLVKILKVKSIWFLIRNTSLAFITCFSLMGLFNWDAMITRFNLTQLKTSQIDFDYLLNLGEEAYPDLMTYYGTHKSEPQVRNRHELWLDLFESFDTRREQLRNKYKSVTWRSYNIRELRLLEKLEKYNLIYTPSPSSRTDYYSQL